jgi:hypothetical protein
VDFAFADLVIAHSLILVFAMAKSPLLGMWFLVKGGPIRMISLCTITQGVSFLVSVGMRFVAAVDIHFKSCKIQGCLSTLESYH